MGNALRLNTSPNNHLIALETGAHNETTNHNRIHIRRVRYIYRATARVGKVGEQNRPDHTQAQDKIGIADLLFLAWNAMKREAGGKPIKGFEVWCETVADVTVGEVLPKATPPEA